MHPSFIIFPIDTWLLISIASLLHAYPLPRFRYRSRFLGRWPSMDSDVKGIEEHSKSLGKVCQLRFFDDFLLTTHRNALCGLVKLWDTITGEMLVGLQ